MHSVKRHILAYIAVVYMYEVSPVIQHHERLPPPPFRQRVISVMREIPACTAREQDMNCSPPPRLYGQQQGHLYPHYKSDIPSQSNMERNNYLCLSCFNSPCSPCIYHPHGARAVHQQFKGFTVQYKDKYFLTC